MTKIRYRWLVCVLLILAGLSLGGCQKSREIQGRWNAGGTTYYFRPDGVLFYKRRSGEKYRGVYTVDRTMDPIVLIARLHGLSGEPTFTTRIEVQFLGSNRMRFDPVSFNGVEETGRSQVLERVTEELEADPAVADNA